MKTILVLTTQHDLVESTLRTVLLLARQFDSRIVGVQLPSLLYHLHFWGPHGEGVPIEHLKEAAQAESRAARAVFETFMKNHCGEASPQYPYSWGRETDRYDMLAAQARLFDLIALSSPEKDARSPTISAVEAILLQSGRPVLFTPRKPRQQLGDNVLIAWNGSVAHARATALAMPILRRARQVTVLSIKGNVLSGPTAAELIRSLQLNNVSAKAETVTKKGSLGETILSCAISGNYDLLVTGTDTQRKFMSIGFSKTTCQILEHASIPVFIAN